MAKGEHIKVKRLGGLYTHHGIDLGDGTVVHYSGEPLRHKDARVCRVPEEEFLQGGEKLIVAYAGELRPSGEVAEVALSLLDEQRYDLWLNNCEHFASYCKTGQRKSSQVRRLVKGAAIGVAVAGTLAVTALRHRLQKERAERVDL